mmetsp:Transcript_66130/g.132709  ORF Transcript_66130/g.132709 Transcript_66130/m.132709 type:complete len:136 (+) Transcript_66130:65-472(+)
MAAASAVEGLRSAEARAADVHDLLWRMSPMCEALEQLARPPPPPEVPQADLGEMVVGFRTPSGMHHEVTFTRQPLGVNFEESAPVVVYSVHEGSHGEEVGVQAGWEVHFVDGTDVRDKGFQFIYSLLKRGCERLS